ncbi:MAG: hypothetical protein C4293_01260 [Nitrospiraceae bacterium]
MHLNQMHQTYLLEAEQAQASREMTSGEHFLVIRRHLWVIVGLAISGAVLVGGWSSMQTPVYEATASIVRVRTCWIETGRLSTIRLLSTCRRTLN